MVKSPAEIQAQVKKTFELSHAPEQVTQAVVQIHAWLSGMLSHGHEPAREFIEMYTGARDELKKEDRPPLAFSPSDMKTICGEARYAIGLCGRKQTHELSNRNNALLRDGFVDLQEAIGYARALLREVTGLAAEGPGVRAPARENILPVYYTGGRPDLTMHERQMMRSLDGVMDALAIAVPHFRKAAVAEPRMRDVVRDLERTITPGSVETIGLALGKVKEAGGYQGNVTLFTNGLLEVGGDLEAFLSRSKGSGTTLRVVAKGMREMHDELFAPAFKAIAAHHQVAGVDAAVDAAGLNRKFLDTLEVMGRGAAHGK